MIRRKKSAAIKDGIAFPAGGQQTGAGENLQMMAHARLLDRENPAQLQHTKRVLGQDPQNIETQRVARRLEQARELVMTPFMVEGVIRKGSGGILELIHAGQSSRKANLYQKFLI